MRLYPQQLFFHGLGSKPEYVFTIDFWHRSPPPSNEAEPGATIWQLFRLDSAYSGEAKSDDDEGEIICATGGADTVVRLWRVVKGGSATGSSSTVNANSQGSPNSSRPAEKDGIDTPMTVSTRDPHLV